jgi:hypothetical protein
VVGGEREEEMDKRIINGPPQEFVPPRQPPARAAKLARNASKREAELIRLIIRLRRCVVAEASGGEGETGAFIMRTLIRTDRVVRAYRERKT